MLSKPERIPPIIPPAYTQYERALIAGFLLNYRSGVLKALETMRDPVVDTLPQWADPVRQYYENAEEFSRFLLGKIGYGVQKDSGFTGP